MAGSEAVKKIGRGVSEVDRAKRNIKTPRLANLAKAPTTPPEIQKYAVRFKQRRDRMRAIHAEDGIFLEKRKLEIDLDVAGLGLNKTETMQLIDRAVIHARKQRGLDTADERAAIASDDRGDANVLNLIKSLWHSPEAVLLAGTLGSANRATYAANLSNANVTELNNAMVKAISTPDRDLAAACCSRIDTLNRDQRQLCKFNKPELCEPLVPEYAVVAEALALSDLYHEQSKLTALKIQGKRIDPTQKVKIGVMLADLESRLGITDPDNLDVPKNETLEQTLDRKFPGKKDSESGFETVAFGDPKRQAEFEAKGGNAASGSLRKADAVWWAAEDKEKGSGDAAVEAFKAGAGS